MSFLSTVQRGQTVKAGKVSSITGSAYGGGYGIGNRLYGYGQEGIDYNKEAGLRWDNSIVYTLLSLLTKTLGGIPIIVARLDDGASGQGVSSAQVTPIPDHPITLLLEKPNPWYSGATLETAAIFQESSRGNSYAYKHRSAGKKLVALEALPEGSCFPYTIPGSGEWISYYAVFTATGYTRVPPTDIMHLRWDTPNPFWIQLGMSPLESCLADVVADKLAARHEAMLLKNGAVSSAFMSPRPTRSSDGEVIFDIDNAQCEQIQRRIDARLSGDNKGSSFVFPIPMEVQQLGFDPTQIALNETRKMSQANLCAAFGIPAGVAGLLVGLENANNRASYAGAVDQFFDGAVIPYARHRGRQLTEDLIPELGQEGEVVLYDESKIPALKSRLVRELMTRTGGPLETPNEGRSELGLAPVEGGDILRQAGQQQQTDNPDDSRTTKNDTKEESQ